MRISPNPSGRAAGVRPIARLRSAADIDAAANAWMSASAWFAVRPWRVRHAATALVDAYSGRVTLVADPKRLGRC